LQVSKTFVKMSVNRHDIAIVRLARLPDDGQITSRAAKPVQPLREKYSTLFLTQLSCVLRALHMRPRVQRAPGLPCVPLGIALRPLFLGQMNLQNSGAACRENAFVRHRPPPGRANARPMTGSGGRSSISRRWKLISDASYYWIPACAGMTAGEFFWQAIT
jgi:hypothetical protein